MAQLRANRFYLTSRVIDKLSRLNDGDTDFDVKLRNEVLNAIYDPEVRVRVDVLLQSMDDSQTFEEYLESLKEIIKIIPESRNQLLNLMKNYD